MRKNGIEKLILTILAAVIIGYSVYTFYLMSSNERIKQLEDELKSKKSTVSQLYNLKKERMQIEQKIKNTEMELLSLEERLPSFNCSNELIQNFYKLYNSKELKISTINSGFQEENDSRGVSRISIQSKGSIKDISDIVRYIRNHKRKLSITMFNLQATPDNTYSATMNVEWSYEKK